MSAGPDAEARRDALEQVEQALPLVAVQRLRHVLLVLDRPFERLVERLAARVREVELSDPPIGRIRMPLEKPAGLELVDDRDHSAARDLHPLAERLLRLALLEADRPEHGEFPRVQLERLEDGLEALRDGVADRRQIEGDSAKRLVHQNDPTRSELFCYELFHMDARGRLSAPSSTGLLH